MGGGRNGHFWGAPIFGQNPEKYCILPQKDAKSGRPKNSRSYHHPSHPPVDALLFWCRGTSECTLVPVFGTGEHPNVPSFRFLAREHLPKPPFWKSPFCNGYLHKSLLRSQIARKGRNHPKPPIFPKTQRCPEIPQEFPLNSY